MRKLFFLFFLLHFVVVSAQEILTEQFTITNSSIEIETQGLDQITIETSLNDTCEIQLFDENLNAHHIIVEQSSSVVRVGFKLEILPGNQVFKKFITKRLHRASVKIKLPKDKILSIIGTNIDVISKSYNGNLMISIDKGEVRLGEVQQNIELKLFQGNVFARCSNTSLDIISNKGEIEINNRLYSKVFKKKLTTDFKQLKVHSIQANIHLKTK